MLQVFPCRRFLDSVYPVFQGLNDELELFHGAPFDLLRPRDAPDVRLDSLIAPISDDSEIVHFIPEAFDLSDLRVRRPAFLSAANARASSSPESSLLEVVRPPVTLERSPR